MIVYFSFDPFEWNKIEYIHYSKAMFFTPIQFVGAGGFYFNVDIPESGMDLWLSDGSATNVITEGNTFIDEKLVNRSELIDSIWYQEFFSKIGIEQLFSNVVLGAESKQPSMTYMNFLLDKL